MINYKMGTSIKNSYLGSQICRSGNASSGSLGQYRGTFICTILPHLISSVLKL